MFKCLTDDLKFNHIKKGIKNILLPLHLSNIQIYQLSRINQLFNFASVNSRPTFSALILMFTTSSPFREKIVRIPSSISL